MRGGGRHGVPRGWQSSLRRAVCVSLGVSRHSGRTFGGDPELTNDRSNFPRAAVARIVES